MDNKTMDEFYAELKADKSISNFIEEYLNLCKRYNLYIDREYYGYEGDYDYVVTELDNETLEMLKKDLTETAKDEHNKSFKDEAVKVKIYNFTEKMIEIAKRHPKSKLARRTLKELGVNSKDEKT